MSGMVERVARAIDPERWAAIDGMNVNDRARSVLVAAEMLRARIAIGAMRKPTDAMLAAAVNAERAYDKHEPLPYGIAWPIMIDAAQEG